MTIDVARTAHPCCTRKSLCSFLDFKISSVGCCVCRYVTWTDGRISVEAYVMPEFVNKKNWRPRIFVSSLIICENPKTHTIDVRVCKPTPLQFKCTVGHRLKPGAENSFGG